MRNFTLDIVRRSSHGNYSRVNFELSKDSYFIDSVPFKHHINIGVISGYLWQQINNKIIVTLCTEEDILC